MSEGKNGRKNGKRKTTAKATEKSEEAKAKLAEVPTGAIVPLESGGALRKGGTNKGGPGRPTNEFKARMKALTELKRKTKAGSRSRKKADYAIEAYMQECLDGEHGSGAFFQAYDRVVDRAEGKVPNVSEIRGSDEPLVIRVVTG